MSGVISHGRMVKVILELPDRGAQELVAKFLANDPALNDLQIERIELAKPSGPPPSSSTGNGSDVFLAHHSSDKLQVERIAEQLRSRGLKPWLDNEQIAPGRPFQEVLQRAISEAKAAAIFIGKNGLGKWQSLELRSFISELVERGIPVIPVLLPGVDALPSELRFLKELNWVRFTDNLNDEEQIQKLVWGITGVHPKPTT